mgnify:CR=1 FL=1
MPSLELLNTISKQLSLHKDKNETDEQWQGRLIYSAIGKLALASLWDSPDEWNDELSVQTFKSKIKANTKYYQKIATPNSLYLADEAALADAIYAFYLRTGIIYHRANWIYPAMHSLYKFGKISIIRNGNPLKFRAMSGLGEYSQEEETPQREYGTLIEMFSLHKTPFAKFVEDLAGNIGWKDIGEFPDGTEYLEHRKFKAGYWAKAPSTDAETSLLRVPQAVGYDYYLYRQTVGGWQWAQIPNWMTTLTIDNDASKEWLAIATGVLMQGKFLPPISVSISDKLVEITLPYLLPPAEEAFFELYSWPLKDFYLTDFKLHYIRNMSVDVYPLFKETMEKLGYEFTEVS